MPNEKQWSQIKFKNNLGPQIGGLIHDAVALTIAEIKYYRKIKMMELGKDDKTIKLTIKYWLDTLYEIAENKKAELTKSTRYDKESKQEEINDELQEATDQEREEQVGTL